MENHLKESTGQAIGQSTYIVTKRNKKISLFLFITPFLGLITVLLIYSISNFIINSVSNSGTSDISPAASFIKVILGLLGLLCVIAIVICVPLGIVYLNKKELVDGTKYDERSGLGNKSIVPKEIKGWNWGAFGLTWIWGAYHGVWISLLSFIPVVGFFIWIILGIKGNEWAWRARKWESVEAFQLSQKNWKRWGIVFFIISLLLNILSFFSE